MPIPPHHSPTIESFLGVPSALWREGDRSFVFSASAGRIGFHVGEEIEASSFDLFFNRRDRAVIAVEIFRVVVGKLCTEISVLVD